MDNNIPENVTCKCIELEKILQDSGYVFVSKNSKEYNKYKNGNYKNAYLVGIFLGEDESTKEKYYTFERMIDADNEEQAIEFFNKNNGFNHKQSTIICSFINKRYCSVLNIK